MFPGVDQDRFRHCSDVTGRSSRKDEKVVSEGCEALKSDQDGILGLLGERGLQEEFGFLFGGVSGSIRGGILRDRLAPVQIVLSDIRADGIRYQIADAPAGPAKGTDTGRGHIQSDYFRGDETSSGVMFVVFSPEVEFCPEFRGYLRPGGFELQARSRYDDKMG